MDRLKMRLFFVYCFHSSAVSSSILVLVNQRVHPQGRKAGAASSVFDTALCRREISTSQLLL